MSGATKSNLQAVKKVRVCGSEFTIRRLNPLLDFPLDRMPQIFTTSPQHLAQVEHPAAQRKVLEDMMQVVEAGVLHPRLVPVGRGEARGREDGVTVEDLFRDPELGYRLYFEVMCHSLNRFSGLRRLFFYLRTRFLLWMLSRPGTVRGLLTSSSRARERA